MAKKTALVVNDDGIRAPGLRLMVELASTLWETYIVTPKEEQSGMGKAISMRVISAEPYEYAPGIPAYAIGGTPADAVLLGIDHLMPRKPDIVLSGMNLGPNLGIEDYLDSGTIGAAIEAALHKIPAVAASLAITKQDKLKGNYGFDCARDLLRQLLTAISSERDSVPPGEIVSLNVPHPDCRGVAATKVSARTMDGVHIRVQGGYAIKPWDMSFYGTGEPDSDINAVVVQKKASVSVVNLNLESRQETATRLAERLSLSK